VREIAPTPLLLLSVLVSSHTVMAGGGAVMGSGDTPAANTNKGGRFQDRIRRKRPMGVTARTGIDTVLQVQAGSSMRLSNVKLLCWLLKSILPSVVDRAGGFLLGEASICLEQSSIRAGLFLPDT